MPPSPASRGVRSALAPTTALLAAALLVACGGMSRLGGDKSATVDPNAGVDRAQAQSQAMMFYLELLHRMVRGGPAEQYKHPCLIGDVNFRMTMPVLNAAG